MEVAGVYPSSHQAKEREREHFLTPVIQRLLFPLWAPAARHQGEQLHSKNHSWSCVFGCMLVMRNNHVTACEAVTVASV